ncbi:MAG: hypothetical protein QOK10_1450, partial [Pseudonocardiales bacterium]|nr:hypothetical protein [Pseudonocardiales bacterium]
STLPASDPPCQFTLTVVPARAMSAGMTVVYFPELPGAGSAGQVAEQVLPGEDPCGLAVHVHQQCVG